MQYIVVYPPLTAENGITDVCSAVFTFSIPKNIPKLLRKQ